MLINNTHLLKGYIGVKHIVIRFTTSKLSIYYTLWTLIKENSGVSTNLCIDYRSIPHGKPIFHSSQYSIV